MPLNKLANEFIHLRNRFQAKISAALDINIWKCRIFSPTSCRVECVQNMTIFTTLDKYFYLFLEVLRIEPKASHILSMCPATELHPSSDRYF